MKYDDKDVPLFKKVICPHCNSYELSCRKKDEENKTTNKETSTDKKEEVTAPPVEKPKEKSNNAYLKTLAIPTGIFLILIIITIRLIIKQKINIIGTDLFKIELTLFNPPDTTKIPMPIKNIATKILLILKVSNIDVAAVFI